MDWYPRKPQSYRNDTWGLTLAEHGAYSLLLDYYYSSESPLPADDRALSSIIGCGLDEWLAVKGAVTRYFRVTNGRMIHDTCDEVMDAQLGKRKGGADRQAKYREKLKTVTRHSPVTDALVTPLEERRGEESKEEGANAPLSEDEPPTLALDIPAQPIAEQEAFDAYNAMAERAGLPKAQKFDQARKAKLRQRLKDCGGLSGWVVALEKLEASSHCRGANDRGWRADFDFLMQAQSFTRLMEGRYDDRKPQQPRHQQQSRVADDETRRRRTAESVSRVLAASGSGS